MPALLDQVKLAMAITTNAYDQELMDLIDAALIDLGIAGVDNSLIHDKLIQRAVITYCRMMFHSPADFENLRWAYESIKGQLRMATGYTDWGDGNYGACGCAYPDFR